MQNISEADEEAARDVMQKIYEEAPERIGADFAFEQRTQPVAVTKNHVARRAPVMRFGMNRAEHRKNLKAMAKEAKQRAKVKAAHDARAVGTFIPARGFDGE